MELEIQRRGGVVDINRSFTLEGHHLVVKDKDRPVRIVELDPEQLSTLGGLIVNAAAIQPGMTTEEFLPPDNQVTTVVARTETEGQNEAYKGIDLQINSGQDVPPEIRALIITVERWTQSHLTS